LLPTGFGYVEGVTSHHVCPGTRTVFAALDVANGKVISRVREHHRYQEFQDFLRQVGKQTPPDLDRRLIVHNHVPHKHGKGKARWARNPLFHFDFTPTFSSWLNQIERRFALVTERAIWRNSLTSVRELKQQFDLFMQRHNTDASPFQCVATADSILQRS
jgi:putative transposase